jgi:hypothetical protein
VNETRARLIERGHRIIDTVRAEGRGLTEAERAELDGIMLNAKIQKMSDAMASEPSGGSQPYGGLYGALMFAGYNRRSSPAAYVPFATFGTPTFGAAATFDGDYSDAVRIERPSPPLGADRRFLFPLLPSEGVESDATSIASFRAKARTLASPSDMIRAIDETSTKPETDTTSELASEPLKQVATIESAVPNIMLESAAMRGWINDDLSFAYATAVDFHVTDQIETASPNTAASGADLLESILLAAEAVAAAGYSPSVLAASPETLIALLLLRQPGTDDYVFSGNQPPLGALRKVAVSGLETSYVLDPNAAGKLYSSPVLVATFEENSGQSNTSTVRIESNALFLVQRVDAIVEVGEVAS